jgi:hypothetical protein
MDFVAALKKAQAAFMAMRDGAHHDISYSDSIIWARPRSWTGIQALVPDAEAPVRFKMVPDHRGGRGAYLPTLMELSEDWEVISPNQFYREQDDFHQQHGLRRV